MQFPPRTIFCVMVVLGICLAVAMTSWRRYVRRIPATLTSEEIIAEMQLRATQAVDSAKTEFNVTLDYSPESIRDIEDILSQLHLQHNQAPFSKDRLIKCALQWGGYVGEVIKKTRASEWAVDSAVGGEGSFPVVYLDKGESFPVRWCYKRIVNGEEDNLWHKFSILVIDREKLPFPPTSDQGDSEDVPTDM